MDNNMISTVYHKVIEGDILRDNKMAAKILSSFILLGLFTHLVLKGQRSEYGYYGPATSLIWGYSITILSVICLVFLQNVNKRTTTIMKIIPLDMLLILILMIWLVSINSAYMTKINSGNVSSSFYSYATMSSYILLVQVLFYLFTSAVSGSDADNNKGIMRNIYFINIMLIILNTLFILAQQVILKSFSVDVL